MCLRYIDILPWQHDASESTGRLLRFATATLKGKEKMNEEPRIVTIVLAEDDPDDQLLIIRAAKANSLPGDVTVVQDGEELLNYLTERIETGEKTALPHLILLDLNMPRKDGREALREIKNHPSLRSIPLIVLTTSTAPEDIAFSYQHGVNAYIAKPARYDDLHNVLKAVKDFWFNTARLPTLT